MLGCKVRIIHERSDIIPISNNIPIPIPTKKSVNKKFYQNGNMNNSVDIYDLKKNFFDPSKSSPPNDFMIKLHQRMRIYETFSETLETNNFNRDKA